MTADAEGLYASPPSYGLTQPVEPPSLLVLTTCGDAADAAALAETLVAERLAACVNVVPGVSSTYRWAGAVERGEEVLVLIKTTNDRFAALEQAIRERSTYELPEVVAVPIAAGSAAFLEWIASSVGPLER